MGYVVNREKRSAARERATSERTICSCAAHMGHTSRHSDTRRQVYQLDRDHHKCVAWNATGDTCPTGANRASLERVAQSRRSSPGTNGHAAAVAHHAARSLEAVVRVRSTCRGTSTAADVGKIASRRPRLGNFAATHVLVQFETGAEAHVPTEALVVQAGQSYVYLALTVDELALPRNVAGTNARGAAADTR